MSIKFTKKRLEKLSLPPIGKPYYKIFRDELLKGFALRVTDEGTKTFIIDKKIHGKLVRKNLGRFGEMTIEEARSLCQSWIVQYMNGKTPVQVAKANKKTPVITLAQVLDDYLNARKTLKHTTKNEYRSVTRRYLGGWLQQPMTAITKDVVMQIHSKIGKHSHASANKVMKVLSALFNFAIANYEDEQGNSLIEHNPVIRLSQTRAWYPKRLRRTKIEISDLPAWFHAVNKLHDTSVQSIANSMKHYLILLLFTGLRREEGMQLVWAERCDPDKTGIESLLDLKNKLISIPDPKNREPHVLPLSDYLIELFTQHFAHTASRYVFPNTKGDKPIHNPYKVRMRVTEKSGVKFTLHDLRRTFASIAESLDIPAYALKRLLNHKIAGSDVTAGYIVTDVERLRKPMQQITDYILGVVEKE